MYKDTDIKTDIELPQVVKDIKKKKELETHIFDEKGMQHDISQTIILQRGEQRWLLEHKHRHHFCR